MAAFDQQASRFLKASTRARKHQQRLEQLHEAEPVGAWLLAVDRDDATDDRAVGCTESPLEAR